MHVHYIFYIEILFKNLIVCKSDNNTLSFFFFFTIISWSTFLLSTYFDWHYEQILYSHIWHLRPLLSFFFVFITKISTIILFRFNIIYALEMFKIIMRQMTQWTHRFNILFLLKIPPIYTFFSNDILHRAPCV